MTIYGLDTETDHDGTKAWIVQWCIHDGRDHWEGRDLDSLKKRLMHLGRKGKHYIYVHNLKYDLAFFVYAIHEIRLEKEGTINAVIRKGSPVSITLMFDGRTLVFRDSMKKWQGSLRSMGEAYGVPKLEAPDEDFSPGWSTRVDMDDPKQWSYVIRDAQIVAIAMSQQHNIGMKKATTSGDAWKDMHRVLNGDQWVPGHDRFSQLFPPLKYELDRDLRPAYFGGINISNHPGECIEGPITHQDVVSMYPGVLYHDPLPIGNPIYIGEELPPDDALYIIKLRIKLRLKDNRIAWLMFKNGFDYQLESEHMEYGSTVEYTDHWHELTLSSVDLDNLQQDYDLEIDPSYKTECWIFKQETGVLRPYIDKWIKVKKEAAKGSAEREHAKRMLNAAYGRFALIQESQLNELVEEDDDLTWVSQMTVSENDAYLPLAIFTTAWARRHLMDRIRLVCDTYGADAMIHADTDSAIYKGEPLEPMGKDLGNWDLEARPIRIYEGGVKRYIEVLKEEPSLKSYSMAASGVPQPLHFDGVPGGMWIELLDHPELILHSYTLGHEDYRIESQWLRKIFTESGRDPDRVNTLKLLPRKVPGGVILEGTQHKLSDNLKMRFNRGL